MTMRVPRRAFLGGCAALLAGCAAPQSNLLRPAGGKADGRILFAVNDASDPKKSGGIWVLTNGGNAKRIIAQDSAVALEYPRWIRAPISPGQMEDRIAFVKVGDRGIYSDLYTARPDGTDQRQMTSFRSKIQYGTDIDAERNYVADSSIVTGVSWSRDGGFLTFASDNRGNGTMRPWVAEDVTARAGDPKIHFITATANLGQPVDSTAASPDGKFMVFSMLWQALNDPNKVSQVYLLNLGTKQWRSLTDTALPFGAYDPTFSPDSQFVAFAGRPDFRVNDIYIMSRDGMAAPQKITDTGAARGPVFSPDGRKIAFLANIDSGQFAIYTMDITPPPDANSPFTVGKPDKVLDGVDWIDARSGLSWVA